MIIKEHGYACDRLSRGDKFVIGNGNYGYRGTLEENVSGDAVALNAAGFYDRYKDKWRETVNMPNPLFVSVKINGIELSEKNAEKHCESLNTSNGIYSRNTVFCVGSIKANVKSERFFLQTRSDLLVSEYNLTLSNDADIEAESGIDCDVWDLNGKHFSVVEKSFCPLSVRGITNEGKELSVTVFETSDAQVSKTYERSGKVLNGYSFYGKTLKLVKYCLLSHSGAESSDFCENVSFELLKKQNAEGWRERLKRCKVKIKTENRLKQAIDYSLYQLLICAPKTENVSISARGVSAQTYKGAVFWDTEMFMLPFFLETDSETAKKLVRYRINSLEGAMAKARSYGFEGAFYAWESQDGGYDACSDYNVTDVFTQRPVRTYFKDKQIHISADVAIALYRAFKKTKDLSLLTTGGMETLLQCALFYDSYAYFNLNKKRLELLDVLGPDEYHERVNNNAYTNYTAHETADCCLKALASLKQAEPVFHSEFVKKHREELWRVRRFKKLIYLPQPNGNGVIEQFDGYFALEDVLPQKLSERLVHKNEYFGGANGVATPTRVIKQADVVALMTVLPERFTQNVKKANYGFYLPYTEHGSSLSASMYALCAIDAGHTDESYAFLEKTATVDLLGEGKKYAGGLYIGGSHPAANGGTWMVLREYVKTNSLPKKIEALSMRLENKTVKVREKL